MTGTFLNNKTTLLAALSLFLGSIYYACQNEKQTTRPDLNSDTEHLLISDDQFVGSEQCMTCHQEAYEAWQGSHHDLAMQEATPETVLGDFSDVSYTTDEGMRSFFYTRGDEYWVNTEGPDGEHHDYKIIYTYGITPLQQYIVAFPDGKYQCLVTAWDTEEKKWFDLYPQLKIVHEEWLHWSRGAMNWNTMCSDCHSTNVKKNFNETTGSFNTTFAIMNVSCEACHGPGRDHLEAVSTQKGDAPYVKTGLKMTKDTPPKALVDACGRCHIRREQLTPAFNWQGSLMDHYYPQLLTERLYHADGQILDEVYVWGSFVQSKMYMNNVTCTDCHDAHSLKLKATDNTLCTSCHEPEKYDVLLHTHHTPDTEGAACINCHMPGRYYMVNDFRRDHSFRIPRPDLSVKYGTPNACNMCHTSRNAEWAWEAFQNWYGEPDYTHFSEVLAWGQTADTASVRALQQMVGDLQEPPIARATGITYLSRFQNENVLKSMVPYLKDPHPLLRAATTDALAQAAPLYFAREMFDGLSDENRAVRIKTYEALAGFPEDQIPLSFRESHVKARQEFYRYFMATADFPGGQAHKALYYQKTGRIDSAILAYEKAIQMDNYQNMARINLANLYYQKGWMQKAESTFREVIRQEPEFAETYYSLGLLYAEQNRISEAITQMEKTLSLQTSNPRIFYNLGLLYQKDQKNERAETVFERGLSHHPQDESLLYAMVFLQAMQMNNKEKARTYLRQLIKLFPDNPDYQQLWSQLSAQGAGPS